MGFYDDKVKDMMAIEGNLNTLKEEHQARKEKMEIAKVAVDAVQADFDAIKAEIKAKMKEDGVKHIDKDIFEIKQPKGKKSVTIIDADKIPDEYVKTERKPVKADIKKLLDSGVKVDWAKIDVSDPDVTISFKEPE